MASTLGVRRTLTVSVRDFTSFLALQQWSEVDSASSSLAASKVRAVQREVLVVAGCALPLDHRTFQPHTLDLARWSTDRVHFSPPLSLALCRARGSIFAVGAHEMRGIHSTIGKQVWFFVVTLLLSNSLLTFPACAAAQVGVDFLHGEEWATSTSFSTEDFRIFDILFDLVELGFLRVRCAARARLPSLSVPPPCFCAPPQCSPSR